MLSIPQNRDKPIDLRNVVTALGREIKVTISHFVTLGFDILDIGTKNSVVK